MSYKVVVVENNSNKVTTGCSLETAKNLIRFFEDCGLEVFAAPEL